MLKERHYLKANLYDESVLWSEVGSARRSASRMSNQSFDKMSQSRYSNYRFDKEKKTFKKLSL